jgi:hypothetical protein
MRLTHTLQNGRSIETAAEIQGNRLRLRARLVDDGLITESLRRIYAADDENAIAEFTVEWERITRASLDRPLFPADFRSLRCPSAPTWFPDPVVFGIVGGTPERPHVTMIPAEPVNAAELEVLAAPATVREVFRIGGVCIREGCRHWRAGNDGAENDGACTLVERVVAANPPVVDKLQRCDIRHVCRWWAQEGPEACRICPGIVTDFGELPQDAESEVAVAFF